MADIALPQQPSPFTQDADAAMGSPLYQNSNNARYQPIEMLPNPDFVFPARPQSASSFANRRPMSANMSSSRLTASHGAGMRKSFSALPDFSFNPSGTTSTMSVPPVTPPLSPSSAVPVTPGRHGHRRGGSEFIGGDGKTGGSGLMSTSPTKGDNILPPPVPTTRLGPPAGRRGHAHRRSGAISAHDLSSIMNPPVPKLPQTQTTSAPSTPAEQNNTPYFSEDRRRTMSESSASGQPDETMESVSTRISGPRARVGFADRVEYIRPLSTISSETESSMSTVRGHSVSNSLSSLASGTASPPQRRNSRLRTSSSIEDFEEKKRPNTAGAILDKGNVRKPNSIRSPPLSPVRPRHRLKTSISEPSLLTSPVSPTSMPSSGAASDDEEKVKSKPKKSRKSWIPFQHKSKSSSSKPKSPKDAPASPLVTEPPVADVTDFDLDANFDIDNTVTIVVPSATERPSLTTSFPNRQLPKTWSPDSDTLSPAIDLDAALGPFNTPSPGTSKRGGHGRSFSSARRSMHSSMNSFVPNQIHRRTESAPELVPFDMRQTVVAQGTKMADVFEEDEEEEEATKDVNSLAALETSPKPIEEAPVEDNTTGNRQDDKSWTFHDGLRIREGGLLSPSVDSLMPLTPPAFEDEASYAANFPLPLSRDSSPLQIVDADEEPRSLQDSDSTITPTGSIDTTKSPPLMNLAIPTQQQFIMTPDTFSSFSTSPNFSPSQASFDTPRLGTASSMTTADNRTTSSMIFGEPGPEFRGSTDDVPSLTSSRSTMTNAPRYMFSPLGPRSIGERSESNASSYSLAQEQRRKRSSIASFSKLMSGSFGGERSKLSIEQRPQSQHAQSALDLSSKKSKRTSRLSKFMHIFKSKDKDNKS